MTTTTLVSNLRSAALPAAACSPSPFWRPVPSRPAPRTARRASPSRPYSRRSTRTRPHAVPRRASTRCWPSPRTTSANSCRASITAWRWPPRTADSNIAGPLANNDAAKMVEQVQLFLASKVGARGRGAGRSGIAEPQPAGDHVVGGYVGTIVPPPATVASQRAAVSHRQDASATPRPTTSTRSSAARPTSCC